MDMNDEQFLYKSSRYIGVKLNESTCLNVKRALSSETYYTNSRGWRVRSADISKPFESDIAIAGCSWALGTGVNYEDSIVGLLEDYLQIKIPNLGVGSASFIQLLRYVETEINFIKPKLLLVPYGSWLVDRSAKERSTRMHYRPILKKNLQKNQLEIIEPKFPPNFISNHYTRINRRFSVPGKIVKREINNWPRSFQLTSYKFPTFIKSYLSTLEFIGKIYAGYPINLIKKILNLSSHTRLNVTRLEDRKLILDYSLNKLTELCKKHHTKLIICHVYEYSGQGFDFRKKYIESDKQELIRLSKNLNFTYHDWTSMEHAFVSYLSQKGLQMKDYLGHVHWEDNNHPNQTGYKLIANTLYPILREELQKLTGTASERY